MIVNWARELGVALPSKLSGVSNAFMNADPSHAKSALAGAEPPSCQCDVCRIQIHKAYSDWIRVARHRCRALLETLSPRDTCKKTVPLCPILLAILVGRRRRLCLLCTSNGVRRLGRGAKGGKVWL